MTEKRKISVPVSQAVYTKIEEIARRTNRTVSVCASRLIGLSLDKEGRRSFPRWLNKRVKAKHRTYKGVSFRQTSEVETVRVQLLLEVELIDEMTELACVLNHRPINLAALLIDHSIDAYEFWIYLARSKPVRMLIRFLTGSNLEDEQEDLMEYPEHNFGPWMDDGD